MEAKYKPNDPQLIENILAEVKRSGMFDQFRKDCISDVDTKPAFQNLQFKVENTVTKFLSSQKWSADTNRNQLREKLRKNILDSGYLESGIERIVDQVLYPKMAGFQSQIEELVYKYLNIDRPKKREPKEEPFEDSLNVSSLLPKDLEAVSSPESDKLAKTPPPLPPPLPQDESLEPIADDSDDESPAFEPLEEIVKKENDDSHLSGLSNMKSECEFDIKTEKEAEKVTPSMESSLKQEEDESQLSQISSRSRLSIVLKSETNSPSPKPEVLNITEEAQMPKFSENSNSIDSRGALKPETTLEGHSVFDFKKEEIEFQGPSRKQMTLDEKLQEEIYESENKHTKMLKMEDLDTNSHSSDMKLEIVEQNITESESGLKIDVDAGTNPDTNDVKKEENDEKDAVFEAPKQEIVETETKTDEKSSEKHAKSSDRSKDRSRSDHKSSKSSKHSSSSSHSKDRDRKHSSSSHHSSSKSRYSDKDRHHSSSSSRHKSSSSSKDRDRKESASSSKDKDRHRSRSSGHKSTRDEKRHSDDHKKDQKTSENEISPPLPLPPLPPLPPVPAEIAQEPPKEPETEVPEPKIPSPAPKSSNIDSDEDDFYGFPEPEAHSFTTPITTPSKIASTITPLSQKLNKSFTDEDSFYGFDDGTPKKPFDTPKILPELTKQTDDDSRSGKRVRKPNAKYLSEDFTTTHDDEEDAAMPEEAEKSKKRKTKITQDIVRLPKKQKSEEKIDEMPDLDEEEPPLVIDENPSPKSHGKKRHESTGESSRSSSRHKK
ncbi:biorientation of chromosomes in cell division protein 1-like 1 [Culicoides brevitarsis]|uniref:biorientation of chromosomes in cell division protein 1-like 1 n=1 Tax=Culicoides brevitarsis TaxID=469753 RepID=UPI00307B5263